MSEGKTRDRALGVVLFIQLFLLTGALCAQESIRDEAGQYVRGAAVVTVGDTKASVQVTFGKPAGGTGGQVWRYSGFELRFDAQDKVESILVNAPFRGKTRKGVGVGTSLDELRRLIPGINKNAQERLADEHISYGMRNEKVVDILITAPPKKKNERDKPDRDKPGNDRPDRDKPGTDRPGNVKPDRVRPVPDRPDQNNPGNDGRDTLVIWEKEWRAADRPEFVDAPVRGWPDDQGVILVRSAYGDRCRGGEHMICEDETSRLEDQDYIFSADLLKSRRKSGKPLRWQFRYAGSGACKVQIIWFDSRQRAERYLKSKPYGTDFAYRGRPGRPIDNRPDRDNWREKAKLVWDHTWNVRSGDDRLLLGPKEDWPDDSGVLLVRAFAGPGIDAFLFRPGIGDLQVLAPGEHLFEPDILDQARRGNIFSGLAGDEKKHLQFGFRGRGRTRVQVWWLPDRRYCDTFCAENSRESLAPWLAAATLPAWIFQGQPKWRDEGRYESDWRQAQFATPTSLYNVASRREGATVIRSDRDRRASQGSEFDGGLWYSEAGGWSAVESRFYAASEISEIAIATAGSDGDAAAYVTVELQREDGNWDRVAALRDENVNWYRLSNGRQAVSRSPLRIACDPRRRYVALRVVFVGPGPFRLGDVRAFGRHVGPPLLDEVDAPSWPGCRLRLPARAGWQDSGVQVARGEQLFIDLSGAISFDADDNGQFGWCGAEGYGSLHCRSAFPDSSSYDSWRSGLLAPQLPAGALLVRIEDGPYGLLETEGPFVAERPGRLLFAYNLPRQGGFRGEIEIGILGGRIDRRPGPGRDLARVVCSGRLTVRATGRGISGVDLIAVADDSSRKVLGGGRSDAEGRFNFEVLVTRGQSFVLRAPEFRLESPPKTFGRDDVFEWNLALD